MNEGWVGRWRPAAALIGVLSLIGWAVSLISQRQAGIQGYLFAYMLWVTLTLGCFGLSLLHHSIRARWSMPLLRIFEAGGGAPMLLMFALFFVPIALNLGDVYPWADPLKVHGDHILEQKVIYLNPGFFVARTAIYFAVWALIAYVLRRSSVKQDTTEDAKSADRRSSFASPALLVMVISVTFAVTDWVMSLEPHWFSSIFGIWFVIQMALMALAFATFFVLVNKKRAPFTNVVNDRLTKDAGTLIFAFTMFWAYITISQFIIIYAANLPESIEYYLVRTKNGWSGLMTFIAVFQFMVPWTALLAPRAKRIIGILGTITAAILAARMVETYWVMMPAMRTSPIPLWSDLLAVTGIGGIWFTIFGWQLSRAPIIANHPVKVEDDEELEEAGQHA